MISLCLNLFGDFGIIKLDHILQKEFSVNYLSISKFDQIFKIKI